MGTMSHLFDESDEVPISLYNMALSQGSAWVLRRSDNRSDGERCRGDGVRQTMEVTGPSKSIPAHFLIILAIHDQ